MLNKPHDFSFLDPSGLSFLTGGRTHSSLVSLVLLFASALPSVSTTRCQGHRAVVTRFFQVDGEATSCLYWAPTGPPSCSSQRPTAGWVSIPCASFKEKRGKESETVPRWQALKPSQSIGVLVWLRAGSTLLSSAHHSRRGCGACPCWALGGRQLGEGLVLVPPTKGRCCVPCQLIHFNQYSLHFP